MSRSLFYYNRVNRVHRSLFALVHLPRSESRLEAKRGIFRRTGSTICLSVCAWNPGAAVETKNFGCNRAEEIPIANGDSNNNHTDDKSPSQGVRQSALPPLDGGHDLIALYLYVYTIIM